MHFLGCLLGLFLAILLIILNIGIRLWWNIRGFLKGNGHGGMNPGDSGRRQGQSQEQNRQGQTSQGGQRTQSHSKVFADDEGEYVDYEEV